MRNLIMRRILLQSGKEVMQKKPKWAEKKTRKVEVGWIHEGKQVRKRKGGGTRTLDVPKQ